MTPGNALYQLFKVRYVRPDPGDGNTIYVRDAQFAVFPLVSTGVQTRTLAAPTKAGVIATVEFDTDGGTITLTVTDGYNADAAEEITLADAGDFVTFISIKVGTSYLWRVLAQEGTNAAIEDLTVDQVSALSILATNISVATGLTVPSIVATNISVATGLSVASVLGTNISCGSATVSSNLGAASILATHLSVGTGVSAKSILATDISIATGLTAPNIVAATAISAASILATNISVANMTANLLTATTAAISVPSVTATNVICQSNLSVASVLGTNISCGSATVSSNLGAASILATNISCGSATVSSNLGAASILATNISVATGLTAASILAPIVSATSKMEANSILATNISVATGLTAPNIVCATGLNVASHRTLGGQTVQVSGGTDAADTQATALLSPTLALISVGTVDKNYFKLPIAALGLACNVINLGSTVGLIGHAAGVSIASATSTALATANAPGSALNLICDGTNWWKRAL